MAVEKPQVDELKELMANLNHFYLVISGILVVFMSCGWAFLEAGTVRSKNSTNVLIKNIVDTFVAGVAYWVFGFAFAYGKGNKFIGYEWFASAYLPTEHYSFFFFQYVFASTSATIVGGAVAERCDFYAYFIYCATITGFVYPVVTHWVWADGGWLSTGSDYIINNQTVSIGMSDFSGSGVVHLVGGTAALFGALIIGPRIGRFDPLSKAALDIRGHSMPLVALGGFILLFGFLAFNSASGMTITTLDSSYVSSISAINTFVSASFGAFTLMGLHKSTYFGNGRFSMLATVNGSICGMVASCAGCNGYYPWGAACVGILAGIFFKITAWIVLKLQIDDPTDTIPMHFNGGTLGVIAVAFFDKDVGILCNWNYASALKLGWQVAGWAAIFLWAGTLSAAMFGIMNFVGILRVTPEVEAGGLDIPEHGEPAYPVESYGYGFTEELKTLDTQGRIMHISQSAPNLTQLEAECNGVANGGTNMAGDLANGGLGNGGLVNGGFQPNIKPGQRLPSDSWSTASSPVILRIGFETPELLKRSEALKRAHGANRGSTNTLSTIFNFEVPVKAPDHNETSTDDPDSVAIAVDTQL